MPDGLGDSSDGEGESKKDGTLVQLLAIIVSTVTVRAATLTNQCPALYTF